MFTNALFHSCWICDQGPVKRTPILKCYEKTWIPISVTAVLPSWCPHDTLEYNSQHSWPLAYLTVPGGSWHLRAYILIMTHFHMEDNAWCQRNPKLERWICLEEVLSFLDSAGSLWPGQEKRRAEFWGPISLLILPTDTNGKENYYCKAGKTQSRATQVE